MKAHLTRLVSGTFIYGWGTLCSRLITFLLLPLTTAYLTPEDYGVLGTLALAPQILSGLFSLGFGISLGRCYWSVTHEEERHGIIWVSLYMLLANIILWISLGAIFSGKISWLLLGSSQYSYLLCLTLFSLGVNTATLPFATLLRMQERATLVVSLLILEVLTTTSLMLYFVIVLDRHAQGVLEAGLIGQGVNFLCLLFIGLRELKWKCNWNYALEMMKIGYPYIFGLLGYFLMQCSSRYILQKYSTLDQVGLLFMGMNFARPMEVVVSSFISAWPPFFTSFINKQEEGARIFSKVLSYYLIGMCSLLVFFFTLAKTIVFVMVHPLYYEVWKIVGILATASALWGVYSISATGFIFYKKSLWQALTEVGAGISSILFCFLLIPFFHKEGAAVATLLSFVVLIGISLGLNRRLFYVAYEGKRIFKTLSALLVVALFSFIPIENLMLYNASMAILQLAFFIFVWCFILESNEKATILKWWPNAWIKKERFMQKEIQAEERLY